MAFRFRPLLVALPAVCAVAPLSPGIIAAQAFSYPSLQLPTASTRDYTGAIAGGRGGTLLGQWRERLLAGSQFGLDAGLADPQGEGGLLLFAGGSVGREVMHATETQPLDLMQTVGVGVAFGGGTSLVRIPVGVSVGHAFDLRTVRDEMSVTPYVHPRLSLDFCTNCNGVRGRQAQLSLNVDVGASLRVSRELAVRAAGVFSSGSLLGTGGAFTVGVTFTPPALTPMASPGATPTPPTGR